MTIVTVVGTPGADRQRRWYAKYGKEWHRQYRAKNRERLNEYHDHWRKNNLQKTRRTVNDSKKRTRFRAMLIIAQRWGDDETRCRFDTLSVNHPLRFAPCYGDLWIDHMNGGGRVEDRKRGSNAFYMSIIEGDRTLDDLRLLCVLHQLWSRPA